MVNILNGNNMDNEQMKQPTYEELAQAYTNAVRALEEVRGELQAVKMDKILDRLQAMMHIVEHKDHYPNAVINLAIWHMKQIMARPKA